MSDPFEELGVEQAFDLDLSDLHRRFIKLSSENHPDRFTDAYEQADAAERSATINDAYRTLQDPMSRASALLKLVGGELKADANALPQTFLVDMMDIREQMEDAIENKDDTALADLRDWAREQRRDRLAQIGALFRRAKVSAFEERPPIYSMIALEINAMRYVERMLQQMP